MVIFSVEYSVSYVHMCN